MPDNNDRTAAIDPFSGMWSDFFAKIGVPADAARGGSPPQGPSNEMQKQMQRAFLDAMARYCDEFMRSEQFLSMMKQTMDRSLAFKQQLDQFLGNVQKGAQAPARADIDDLAGTLLKIEERVLDRLDALEQKVAAVESRRGEREARRGAGASRAQRPSSRGGPRNRRKR